MTSYSYTHATADPLLLWKEAKSALTSPGAALLASIDLEVDQVTVNVSSALSGADKTTLDQVVSDHDPANNLSVAKQAKNEEIDSKTRFLIAQGFSYAGKVFSLSQHAQSYWNGLGNLAANNLLTEPDDFPLEVNTADDSDTYNIANIADAVGIFATAAATVKAHLASGTGLKNQVRAAATVAEVNAVVDSR